MTARNVYAPRARPPAITVLCVILFMVGASQMVHAFVAFGIHADSRSLYGIVFSALALLSYYGLWNMRRWSVFLFASVWIFNIIVLSLMFTDASFLAHIRLWACVIVLVGYFTVILPHWKSFKTTQPNRVADD